MKIVCSLLLIFSLLFGTVLPVASAPEEMPPSSFLSLSAQSAVLMCAENREILYEKNASLPLGMASTTKLMTALVVTEQTKAERVISVPPAATGIEGSSIYLSAGERLTVEELLYALLLSSANDAAVALALTVSPTVEDFCALMNKKAAELGLTDTHFKILTASTMRNIIPPPVSWGSSPQRCWRFLCCAESSPPKRQRSPTTESRIGGFWSTITVSFPSIPTPSV